MDFSISNRTAYLKRLDVSIPFLWTPCFKAFRPFDTTNYCALDNIFWSGTSICKLNSNDGLKYEHYPHSNNGLSE